MDRLKSLFNNDNYFGIFEDEDEEGNNYIRYFQLSLKNRIYGFVICICIGLLLSLLGVITLFFMKLTMFAVLYSLGNIINIVGICILISPMKQLKNMFQPHRLIATLIFLLSIVLTLLSAFYWKKTVLCILFLIIQLCAYTWYCLSYIPYARTMCCKMGNCLANNIV